MQRIGRGIVHPTSLTQTLEHRGIPPAIASPIFVNPLVEFIHLLRSSAPNSLLSSCRASSTACFSFLMVFTIPGEPHEPQAICLSLRWYHFGGLALVDPLLQNLPSLAGFTFATAILQL